MIASASLIEPSFDLASVLKNFRFQETLLAAVKLPDHYRADLQSPLFNWLVLTDSHLVLSGDDAFWQFDLPKISALDYGQDKDGCARITISYPWKNVTLKGYFGSAEEKLVKALQLAANFTGQPGGASFLPKIFAFIFSKLLLVNIILLVVIFFTWRYITNIILTF
ncbi:MAG: hypothetical protein WC838_07220 [Candidatus Margulisiibacteriota bacterium]|jgi:hypothetical protein